MVKSSKKSVLVIVLALLAVSVLLLLGLEFAARYKASRCAEHELFESLQADVDVSFSAYPMLASPITGNLPDITVSSRNKVDASSQLYVPAQDTTSSMSATLSGIELSDGGPIAGGLQATVEIPAAAMAKAATAGAPDKGGLLGAVASSVGITADEQQGVLKVDVVGGLASATITPSVVDGRLELTPTQATALGFALPTTSVDRISEGINASLDRLPAGLRVTEAVVTARGLRVSMNGDDVNLVKTIASGAGQAVGDIPDVNGFTLLAGLALCQTS